MRSWHSHIVAGEGQPQSRPDVGALMRKIPAGMMMGAGAYLIPGGNDALTLQGLPLLQPYAFVAYATMTATIAGLVFLMTKIGRDKDAD